MSGKPAEPRVGSDRNRGVIGLPDVLDVLDDFDRGTMSAEAVEGWADALEVRDKEVWPFRQDVEVADRRSGGTSSSRCRRDWRIHSCWFRVAVTG